MNKSKTHQQLNGTILFRMKHRIKSLKNLLEEELSHARLDIDYDNAIIFMLACDYNNIGDVLIRIAQEYFLKVTAKQKQIVTIGYNDTNKFLKDIRNNATKNTIIVLTGGGDVDDRYTGIERIRDRIIKTLAANECRIISFPQTIDYGKTRRGRYYLGLAQKAYASNRNLTFVAREKISFNFAQKSFPSTNILLTPDIVLSLDRTQAPKKRNGIGLLVRNDSEKSLDNNFLQTIIDELKQRGYSVEKNDMTVTNFDRTKIYDYANQKITFAHEKKVIITDRLHGMILCYITNTPCVVFQNTNHKISETFHNWLEKTQNFIILEEKSDEKQVIADIEKLMRISKIEKRSLSSHYSRLAAIIRD